MNLPPNYVGRTSSEILDQQSYFDSAGYLFRAMSWLDLFERQQQWPMLLYACIEGRYGIEYLLFEELVIGTGANLSRKDYEQCIKSATKLKNQICRLLPDYKKVQQFTSIMVSFIPGLPNIVFWEPNDLMKAWALLSDHLHWGGHRLETTEDAVWRDEALNKIKPVLLSIWIKLSSGVSACMPPDQMRPEIRDIWLAFKEDQIDVQQAKFRVDLLRPMLERKYATNREWLSVIMLE